jgi:mannosylglycerate hydrolase
MTETHSSKEPTVVHLVPHTHWDREWYEPFQTFRMRLVELIDELLARMSEDPRLRFTLDGQAATVDDYLEIRPEAEPLIRRLIKEHRLAIGPWQILMDEFLVSGETIIRNLEFGWARAEELGGAMPVGYLPDMFGHIAQMPQILRRAGIDRAVVWRGVPMAIDRSSFLWRAPDGSQVEAEYLVGGYGNGAYLFDVPDLLADKLVGYRVANAAFYGERSLLAMYGTDHAVPSPRLADLVEEVNGVGGDIVVRLETLADYAGRHDVAADGAEDRPLPTWTGELRSGARANMLMGVTSARVDLKAAASRAERLLERYAEPLAALHGGAWAAQARFLELAWRRVVDNSAHDSICGCSHDEVVSQVITRFAEAEQIARGVVRSTLRRIAEKVRARSWAVVNPSPVARDDLVELDVAIPPEWGAVAVRAGNRLLPTQESSRPDPVIADLRLPGRDIPELLARRRHGRELFGRLMSGVVIEAGSEGVSPRLTILVDDVPDPAELDVDDLIERIEAATSAERDATWSVFLRAADRRRLDARIPVAALSWTEIEIIEVGADSDAGDPAAGPAGTEPIDHPVAARKRSLSNGLVAVEVANDGTFSLSGGGAELTGVGRLVDGGDAGDSYNYARPAADVIVERPSSVVVAVTAVGPLRGRLQIVRTYDWPIGLSDDGATRSDRAAATEVTTDLELRAGEPFVRVRLAFDNASRDHRVRWHIPLPAPVAGSAAEGQFAVVGRGLEMEGGHGEVPLPTFPARGFVGVDGLTVLLDQITEYEVVGGTELALTILRSFGLISRNTNAYREDPAGPQVPVPNAQLRGERTIAFALAPHAGGWERAGATALQERYQHAFLLTRGAGAAGSQPTTGEPVAGFDITGDGVVLSALRRRGDRLEARVVHQGTQPVEAVIRGSFTAARRVDLLARPGEELPVEAPGVLRLQLAPWEIATIQLKDGPR